MTKKSISQQELKNILCYDPITGIFTYIKRTANCINIGDIAGWINSCGYLNIKINGTSYKLHRLAWLYVYGCFPKNQIDHINHLRSDNRLINLRCVTNTNNQRNASIAKTNTSGVMGVSFFKKQGRWYAEISNNNKKIYLGCFYNFNDAVIARKMAEKEYGYHINHN